MTEHIFCKYCNKPLVSIGDKRKNGKMNLKDKKYRQLHRKCYFALESLERWKQICKNEGITI